MRYPRTTIFILNATALFSAAVMTQMANPANMPAVVGYGMAFLAALLVVDALTLACWRRWSSKLTALVLVLVFGAFTALGDHVAVGLLAAVQMAACIAVLPAWRPAGLRKSGTPLARTSVVLEPAGEMERLERLVAEGEAAAAYLRSRR